MNISEYHDNKEHEFSTCIDTGQGSDVGCVRKINEDSLLAAAEQRVWLLADGMGGHQGGHVASEIAVGHTLHGITTKLTPEEAINDAHRQIKRIAETDQGFVGMGSTIVSAKLEGTRLKLAWVGDSRAYYLEGGSAEKPLLQVTKDHSYVQMLLDQGKITAQEMRTHPQKHVITQCLGSTEMESIQVGTKTIPFLHTDRVLLCSDGLFDAVDEAQILKLLSAADSAQEAADKLIEAALDNAASDNVSVLTLFHLGNQPELAEDSKSKNGVDTAARDRSEGHSKRRWSVNAAQQVANVLASILPQSLHQYFFGNK